MHRRLCSADKHQPRGHLSTSALTGAVKAEVWNPAQCYGEKKFTSSYLYVQTKYAHQNGFNTAFRSRKLCVRLQWPSNIQNYRQFPESNLRVVGCCWVSKAFKFYLLFFQAHSVSHQCTDTHTQPSFYELLKVTRVESD